MRQIFIGFYGWPAGPEINQDEAVRIIAEGFECWNLRKFTASEFVSAIQEKIPPENPNWLTNYIHTAPERTSQLSEENYGKALWGLLLPDPQENSGGYTEVLSLLNLFSMEYMHPAFYVTHQGITKVSNFIERDVQPNDMQGHEQFKSLDFVSFFNALIDQMKYFIWRRDEVVTWGNEDWRLFMATLFYTNLDQYQKSKKAFTWQRESTDMATLLETLFTAGDRQTEEIGYRLRKRAAALIGWKFDDIEKELKGLYNDRSEFVHGDYYKKIIKEMKKNEHDPAMPLFPDFKKLYKIKERIRIILIAYLYLHKVRVSGSEPLFQAYTSVQNMLEDSILNIDLRSRIMETIEPLINKVPLDISTNVQ